MRLPDYRAASRETGFVPGQRPAKPAEPPRTIQRNGATRMGMGQPAGNQGQATSPMPPTPPTGGGAPPPMGPPMPPPGPGVYPQGAPADQERALWANRHSRNPMAVLADAYQLTGQAPDYLTMTQLLQRGSLDDALLQILGPESAVGRAVTPPSMSRVQSAILG